MASIRCRDLAIRRGGMVVLDQVSFELYPGLFVLLGSNGAGKSSLLRTLAGVLLPASGVVEIEGHDLWRDPIAARRSLGYLPESYELFPYLTPRELLRTINAVRGVAAEAGEERFSAWVRPEALDLRIGTLSSGQRRKLALVAASSHEPKVLLLDEPTNALDAAAVADLRGMLLEWRERGHTVIVATHRVDGVVDGVDGRLRVVDRRVRVE